MFDKKKYYISSLSLKNRYRVLKELPNQSSYERRFLTLDEYNVEHVILFERIGNSLPDARYLLFEIPIHESIVFPVDLIEKSNIYVYENEIGYVYPVSFLDFESLDSVMAKSNKEAKARILQQLCNVLVSIHTRSIFLNGFDKKQVLIKADEISFRYNGFKNHNRNSIYRVPDYITKNYLNTPWLFDAFSIVAIIFEYMYGWNPFCGMMTSFSDDEEYQFEVYYNNFRKKIFIFEQDKKLNQIGFLIEQRDIIEKWQETDLKIRDFFNHILTMSIPEQYTQEIVFEKIYQLIDYYFKQELFQ